MAEFEYRYVDITVATSNTWGRKITPELREVERAGRDGWEMVGYMPNTDEEYRKVAGWAIMKREQR